MAKNMAIYGLQHQQSRLAGEIGRLKWVNAQNQSKIADLNSRIAANQAKIEVLTTQVQTLAEAAQTAFGTELGEPIPRRTVPKLHIADWGTVTRSVLRQLALSQGVPLTTEQLAERINLQLKLGLSEEELRAFKTALRHTLKRLRNNGKVERATTAASLGDYSTWVLASSV